LLTCYIHTIAERIWPRVLLHVFTVLL
jgi:hypothetical protein